MLRTARSHPPDRALDAALRPGPFPDRAASLLPGLLAATRTGLTPAGDDELMLDHELTSFDLQRLGALRLSRESCGCRDPSLPLRRRTLKVMGRSSIQKVEVRADGTGLSSRAGTALLPLAAERLGLTDALGWALGETRERRSAHDPGRVFCDLAVMLADGGRCVSDLVALGSQPALFGDVASVSTARRVLLSVGEAELDRLRAARAQARARAWAAGAAPARGDPRLRRDADHRAFGQGARGRPLQGRVRVSIRCWRAAGGRCWPRSCGPATPAPTTPTITWRCSSCARAAPAGGAGGADPRALGLGRRQPRAGRRVPRDAACGSRSATRSTSGCARRSSRCPKRRGGRRSTATASRARARGWPS